MSNDLLIERLDQLYQKIALIKEENLRLQMLNQEIKKENETVKRINTIQKNSIEILEQRKKISNIAETVSNFPQIDKQALRKSINEQIREIDKCLKLLKI